MGKVDSGQIINLAVVGGVVWLGYTLVKPILDTFGITQSAGSAAYSNATTTVASPWSPTYYNKVIPNGTKVTLLTAASANNIAKAIKSTYDDFDIQWGSDVSGLKSAFNQITSKIKLSQVSGVYASLYGADLLTDINSNFLDSDVNTIITYVNNLPVK